MPGRGLEGDRYFWGLGTFSGGSDTELTLIEAEAVEALAREHGLHLDPGEAQRGHPRRRSERPRRPGVPHRGDPFARSAGRKENPAHGPSGVSCATAFVPFGR